MKKLVAALGAALALGCNSFPTTCDRDVEDNPPIRYEDGIVEGQVYRTSAANGPLLNLPGGIRYELVHGLGSTPIWVDAYLSFDREGVDDGTLAPAAGNQLEVEDIDDESIVVTNGSCVEYWLLVVAGTGTDHATP